MGSTLVKLVFLKGSEPVWLEPAEKAEGPAWDLKVQDITGNTVELRELVKGFKAVLFVNVATK